MADITASVVSWSTTESSNQPTDSTTIGAGLDDNLRAIQAGTAREFAKGSDLPSASSVDIGASGTSGFVDITGTTTITSFATARAGTRRWVRFNGALTLTHNATSLILPTGANITTQAGHVALFISLGSGNWVCARYPGAFNSVTVNGGSITHSTTTGGDFNTFTTSAAGSEAALRLTASDATSGIALKLSNSGLNKQATVRGRSDGGITFYTNQTSGGGSTSGTQGADLDASGYFNAVRVSENATRTFSRNSAFVSSTQTYTSTSQTMTFAHGFGAKPVSYDAYAVCNTIDNGYAVGDEIKITSLSSAIESVTVSCDATNVYVAIKGGIPATDRTTPSTYAALTANRWDVYVRAWY